MTDCRFCSRWLPLRPRYRASSQSVSFSALRVTEWSLATVLDFRTPLVFIDVNTKNPISWLFLSCFRAEFFALDFRAGFSRSECTPVLRHKKRVRHRQARDELYVDVLPLVPSECLKSACTPSALFFLSLSSR